MTSSEGSIRSDVNRRTGFLGVPGVRDDRILPEVHWLAGVIVLVLVTAALILYLFPDRTADLFAWTINPTMSALLMGAGYGAGAYYFARVFFSPKWHWIGIYFPAIAVFTAVQG